MRWRLIDAADIPGTEKGAVLLAGRNLGVGC